MYKKIVTVVEAEMYAMPNWHFVAVYISSKKVWSGPKNEFSGYVVLDLIEGVKSYFEIRYKKADTVWWRSKLKWPESLKEVKYEEKEI